MRLLIGFYLALAVLNGALTLAIAYQGVQLQSRVREGNLKSTLNDDNGLFIQLGSLIAALPLLVAFGLCKRWRLLRLALLIISWWTVAVCIIACAVAVGRLSGLIEGSVAGFPEAPVHTLAIALGLSAIACLHFWVLLRPEVRVTFEVKR